MCGERPRTLRPVGGTLLSISVLQCRTGSCYPSVSDSRPQARSSCAARRGRRAVCDDADHSLVTAARRDGRRDLQSRGRRSRCDRAPDWCRGRCASRFAALRAVSYAAVIARGLRRAAVCRPHGGRAPRLERVDRCDQPPHHLESPRPRAPIRVTPLTRFAVRRIVSSRVSCPRTHVPTHPRTREPDEPFRSGGCLCGLLFYVWPLWP